MRWIIDQKIKVYEIFLGRPEGRYVDVTLIRKICFGKTV
jgi:hypothetical protein